MTRRAKILRWGLGIVISLLGVVVARVIAPGLPPAYQFYGLVVGATIGVVGIFVAASGSGSEPKSNDAETAGADNKADEAKNDGST